MKRYKIILADPAWPYRDKRPGRGGAESHYETMRARDIRFLPVERLAARDAVLFLWVTSPNLPMGLAVMRAWGFDYVTKAFSWVKRGKTGKLAWGTGAWTRANTEDCLLGTRGSPKRLSAAVHQVIEAPRGEHSSKPLEVHRRIVDLMGDVPRVELFARESVPGWDRWGDQAPTGPGRINLEAA